jgi:hypothetical protein
MEDLPMGRYVLKKLRSDKGASLTFALLAFLVCAVISAVLLASASAAAGRVSGLAASDQRYYAVTSAAQLFCDTLNEQEFTIERVKTTAVYKRYLHTLDDDGNEIPPAGEESWPDTVPIPSSMIVPYTYSITFKSFNSDEPNSYVSENSVAMDASFLTEAAYRYVFGNYIDEANGKQVDTLAARDFNNAITVVRTKTWGTMNLSVGGMNELLVDINAEMKADGTIILKFTNHNAAVGEKFTVQVTLAASASDDSITNEKTLEQYAPGAEGTNTYYVNTATITTVTKTTAVKWTVADIKKVPE